MRELLRPVRHALRMGAVGAIAVIAASQLIGVPAARASSWLVGSDGTGALYEIDPDDGSSALYATTGISGLVGISWDGRRTLYGLSTFGSSPGANSLYRIDLPTGTTTRIGATGLSNIFEGDLDFDPISGLLYGLVDMPALGVTNLFRLDTATGAATVISQIPFTIDPSAMAFASDGTLYVLDNAESRPSLITIDVASGVVTSRVQTTTIRASTAAGMDWSPDDGLLYVATNRVGGPLYRLDAITGTATLVGNGSTPFGYWGLRFVPEPGTALLVAGGLGVIALKRVRRC